MTGGRSRRGLGFFIEDEQSASREDSPAPQKSGADTLTLKLFGTCRGLDGPNSFDGVLRLFVELTNHLARMIAAHDFARLFRAFQFTNDIRLFIFDRGKNL